MSAENFKDGKKTLDAVLTTEVGVMDISATVKRMETTLSGNEAQTQKLIELMEELKLDTGGLSYNFPEGRKEGRREGREEGEGEVGETQNADMFVFIYVQQRKPPRARPTNCSPQSENVIPPT